jgi:hypothetical protein
LPINGANDSVHIASQSGLYSVRLIGSNGCSSISNSIATGLLNKQNVENEIEIYPNPSNGKFDFSLKQTTSTKVTISILDVEGKLVYTKVMTFRDQANGRYSINCDFLPNGNYVLSINDQHQVITKKITIIKN